MPEHALAITGTEASDVGRSWFEQPSNCDRRSVHVDTIATPVVSASTAQAVGVFAKRMRERGQWLGMWPGIPGVDDRRRARLLRAGRVATHVAWDAAPSRVVALGHALEIPGDPAIVWAGLTVAPEHRHSGIRERLYTTLVDTGKAWGGKRLRWAAPASAEASDFARAHGGILAGAYHLLLIDLGRVDRQSIDLARRSAPECGTRLVRWIGACPPHHADSYAALLARASRLMADHPGPTVSEGSDPVTRLRNAEDDRDADGCATLTLCGQDTGSGELIAVTRVIVPTGHAGQAVQNLTAVLRSHQGRGLARRLKVEMLGWLMEEHPDIDLLESVVACGNVRMSWINHRLGFRARGRMEMWERTLP